MARTKKAPPRVGVDPNAVKRITAAMLDIDQQKAELTRDRAEYSAEARENQLHAKAHSWAIQAARMPAGDRHLLLACFDEFRTILKLDDFQSAEDPQSDIEDAARAA